MSADTFGGLVAKGVEKFGEETTQAGNRWSQIQTDYELNNALKEADKVAEDYGNLRGQDALDQQQATQDRLDQIRSDRIAHLLPPQVLEFDRAWRPFRDRYLYGKIATHSIQQGYNFGKEQNTAALGRANQIAADSNGDPAIIGDPNNPAPGTALYTARHAAAKQLDLDGASGDLDVKRRVLAEADAEVYKSAAEAMYAAHPDHPEAAAQYVDAHRDGLGPHYAQLAEKYRARANIVEDHQTADTAVKQQDVTGPGRAPVAPFTPSNANVLQFPSGKPAGERPSPWQSWKGNQGAAPAKAGPDTRTMIQIESGGRPQYGGHYAGLGQFDRDEQKRFGITDPNNRQQVDVAYKLEANENKPALTAALGHEPTAADYYLAHQQGRAGLVNHITHPDRPAWANMHDTAEGRAKGIGWAKRAVWGNMTKEMRAQFPGGVDTVTSGQFVRLWTAHHDQIARHFAASEE